jgi:hypothetical protein
MGENNLGQTKSSPISITKSDKTLLLHSPSIFIAAG